MATGSLSLSGGSFPLTADANFGNNFGLVALYFKSVAANISTAGILRMANAATIGWRNSGLSGNNTLTSNASDQLEYTGGDIKAATGKYFIVVSPDGSKTMKIGVNNEGNPIFDVT